MKLIGITGKAGAGKTTISNIIAQNNNVGVIHVDDVLKDVKLKYLKLFMDTDNKGEKTKVNGKIKMFLFRNKIMFNLIMKFRNLLVTKYIENEIQKLQDKGKDIILIDDIYIKFLHIYNNLDRLFVVERNYNERKEALKQRDDLTLQEVVASDIAHFKGVYKEVSKGKNVEKVFNNGTRESLTEKAKEIYEKYFISSREQFKRSVSKRQGDGEYKDTRILPNQSNKERKIRGEELL